jgi:predicted nucleic acid-binding protein
MLFIMRYVDSGRIDGTASAIALTEVLVQPLRSGNSALAKRYEAVLSNSLHFHLEPVSAKIARQGASLRATYHLRTPDALHIATALDVGCDAFLTNDLDIKRVTEINVLVLDELALPGT